MASTTVAVDQWAARRNRAVELAKQWLFATPVLTFYTSLLGVQEQAYLAGADAALSDRARAVAFIVERVLPPVLDATISNGPEKLARSLAEDPSFTRWETSVEQWLEGEDLPAVDRYIARAAAGPVLEALGPMARQMCGGPNDARHCPHCGGAPQLSVLAAAREDLVAPRRYLECSRCAWRWQYPRMTCAGCGETDARHQLVFAEERALDPGGAHTVVRGAAGSSDGAAAKPTVQFPHISIHACETCSQYLMNIDLSRVPRAIPVVDEIAAIPLDLNAKERGLVKIVPNLVGF